MTGQRPVSVVAEPDERLAPLVFAYLAVVVAALAAILAWVYYFRGYA
jgi:hypothetical protein